MKKCTFYCLSAILILLVAGCGKAKKDEVSDKVVLKVGNVAITEYEFKKNLPTDLAGKTGSKEYNEWLNNYIDDVYFLADAYSKHYDTIIAIQKTLDNSAKEMVGKVDGYLWQMQATPQLEIAEAEIKDAYSKRDSVYFLDYILFLDTSLVKKYVPSFTSKISYDDFVELKKNCTQEKDVLLKNGSYQWPFVEIYPVAKKILTMSEGEVMPPVTTPTGTFIVFLSKKEKVNKIPYEREKDIIKWDIYSVKAREIMREKQQLIFSQAKINLDEAVIGKLAEAFDVVKATKDSTSLRYLLSDTLMSYRFEGKIIDYTVCHYLDYVTHFPFLQDDYTLLDNISVCLKNVVIKEYTFNEAVQLKILENKKYVLDRKNFLNNLMLSQYYQKEFIDNILIDDDELKTYYENHKTEYLEPERVAVSFLFFSDQNAAYSNLTRVEKIISEEDYSAFSSRDSLSGLQLYLPNQLVEYNSHEFSKEVMQAIFGLPVCAVSQPMVHNNQWLLCFVIQKEGLRLKDYGEITEQLRFQLEQQDLAVLRDERLIRLKKDYTLTIQKLIN